MIPIQYSLRNLIRRRANTLATAFGIALVVFVSSAAGMLAAGIRHTLMASGEQDSAIVLRKGSDGELSSVLEEELAAQVLSAPGIASSPNGRPLGTDELLVVAGMKRIADGNIATVSIRGITDTSFALRSGLSFIEGRAPRPNTSEIVIGKQMRGRFQGLEVGQSFELTRNRPVQVVGVFACNGSSYESEVWADANLTRNAFGRAGLSSSIRVRLKSANAFDEFRTALVKDRRFAMEVYRERTFFEKQSEGTATFIVAIGTLISIFFSIAAMLGAMITMNASIARRRREMGTLRALGFSRTSILFAIILESCLLAVAGGIVGAAVSTALGFVKVSMMNYASFSEMVFEFRPSAQTILSAVFTALLMGLFGGLLPALRAARIPAASALRD